MNISIAHCLLTLGFGANSVGWHIALAGPCYRKLRVEAWGEPDSPPCHPRAQVSPFDLIAVSNQTHMLSFDSFVTLSTISSLAVAPMLPIWRLSPEEFYERHRRRHALLYTDRDDPRYVHDVSVLNASLEANTRKLRIKKAQRRQRIIISVVLLLQVVLQWAWGISLFVDPEYSQDYLNNSTRLILFFAPFETGSINSTAENPHAGGFLLWASWILFCLCTTMALVVNLAISGSSHSQTSLSSVRTGLGTGHTSYTSGTPIGKQWERIIRESVFLTITWRQAVQVLRVSLVIILWALFIAGNVK